MMISPETFYDEELKGKTPEQMLTVIRSLKRQIGLLRRESVCKDYVMDPSVDVQVACMKLYIERAKQAIVEAGGTYKPTKAEQKEAAFKARIPFLKKMVLRIGGFGPGEKEACIDVGEEVCYVSVKDHSSYDGYVKENVPVDAFEFFELFNKLDIYEWKKRYVLSDDILDGEMWDLELIFSDGGKPLRYHGHEDYPPNFYDLECLFDLDSYCEYEE